MTRRTTKGRPHPRGRLHPCAAFGCEKRVGQRYFMCPRHWALVPPPIQQAVYATYAYGARTAAHSAACQQAISSVVRQGDLFEG